MRKDLDDCLDLIKSEKIREFVKRALNKAPKEFWTAPCSSSGKYHPPEDNVEGGVIVHVRKAIQVALTLFKFFDITDQLIKDKIIGAIILHDIKKNGDPWGDRTHPEHGLIAARWLNEILNTYSREEATYYCNSDLIDMIELVRNHMGIWNQPESTPALVLRKRCLSQRHVLHLIVQLADYWASRKWCSFVCDKFDKCSDD
ncbi:MAG: hypothetical protein ACP5IX_00955 [Patescibacteria group bacterium]